MPLDKDSASAAALPSHDREALAAARLKEEAQAGRLRELELLESIANESNDVIFAKDLEGRYLMFNRAAGETFGLDAKRMIGRDVRDLMPASAAEALAADEARVMAENRLITCEEQLQTPHGLRTLSITRGPLHDASGAVIGLFGISRDITERNTFERKLEAQVAQRSADLQAANVKLAEAEVFLRTIADHIPGRVAYWHSDSTCGFVNQVYCDWFGRTREELVGRSMEEIFGAERLSVRRARIGLGLSITRQLAALMGGAAGVESTPGVGSTFWFSARLGHARDAGVAKRSPWPQGSRCLLADDLPEAREALLHMLRQIGLSVDAVESGEQALALADVADAEGTPYSIAILDWMMSGIDGIETFRRLKARARRKDLCCIVVTAHDDEQMWRTARQLGIRTVLLKPVSLSTLHDALNEALAEIEMPDARSSAATGQEFRALQASRAGAQVLLAEDNVVNQEVATELLRSAGLEVDVVGNGAEAIEKVRALAYDLILMDVQMPEVDGLQAARTVRTLRNGRTVPIIAMTANAFGEDREACLAAGMNDHVAKPVDPDHLYATLLRWIPARIGAATLPPADEPPEVAADRSPALWAALGGIRGLDTVRGLELFDGQAELYLRVLRRFVAAYGQGMPALAAAASSGDATGLAAAAHSLRGAAAAIGAAVLQQAASRLEALDLSAAADAAADALAQGAALQAALVDLARRMSEVLARSDAASG